jgi:hypothetical protein
MNAAISPKFSSAFALFLLFVTTTGTGTRPVAEGIASSSRAASPSDLLDGKTFVAQSGEKGKQASNKDTIVFRNGRFLSEGCKPYGFGDAPYQATVDGTTVHFHAETRSPTHGTMVWNGIVQGDTIEATNTWTRKRWYWNIKKEYWYKGHLKG